MLAVLQSITFDQGTYLESRRCGGNTGGRWFLGSSAYTQLAFYINQDYFLGNGTAHSGVDFSTSINNQHPYDTPINQIYVGNIAIATSFPGDTRLCHGDSWSQLRPKFCAFVIVQSMAKSGYKYSYSLFLQWEIQPALVSSRPFPLKTTTMHALSIHHGSINCGNFLY